MMRKLYPSTPPQIILKLKSSIVISQSTTKTWYNTLPSQPHVSVQDKSFHTYKNFFKHTPNIFLKCRMCEQDKEH